MNRNASSRSAEVRSRREHDDRDNRAHRHLAFLETIEPADEEADAYDLLGHTRQVYRDGGELAHAFLVAADIAE